MKTHITCTDKDGGKQEVPVSDLVWRPTAYGIIIRDDKILLSPQFDWHDLPGGGLDLGETPEKWVVREIKEETGYDAQVKEFITFRNCFYTFRRRGIHAQTLIFYFLCEIIWGELSTEWFDEGEKNYAKLAEWIPLSELPNIKVENTIDWRPIVDNLLS